MKLNASSVFSLAAFAAALIAPISANAGTATIYACKVNALGTIRIVSATTTCSRYETKISWDGSAACFNGPSRFQDCGDGTVSDKTTGLIWEKKTGTPGAYPVCAPGCLDSHDVNNVYTWSRGGSSGDFTEPSGTLYSDFLERLNDLKTPDDGTATPCFANHCDWRIPTIGELRSILSSPYPTCSTAPCIDPAFGPTQASNYWSSSSFASSPSSAWVVYFIYGAVRYNGKDNDIYARAVRGGR